MVIDEDKINEVISTSKSPEAMAAFVDLALGKPTKKTVTKYMVTRNKNTGRKQREAIEEVVTEQTVKADRWCLEKLLELTGDLKSVDTQIKEQKLNKAAKEDDDELYEETEGLL